MAILDDVKKSLRVTHTEDDALITRLINSASNECAQYVYGKIPSYSGSGAVADPKEVPELLQGIILMVQADYDGDPLQRSEYLRQAKTLWDTARSNWGV